MSLKDKPLQGELPIVDPQAETPETPAGKVESAQAESVQAEPAQAATGVGEDSPAPEAVAESVESADAAVSAQVVVTDSELPAEHGDAPAGDDAQNVPAAATESAPAEPQAETAEETAKEETDEEEFAPGEMSLIEHLKELRVRISRSVIALLIGFAICGNYAKDIFHILMEPMLKALNSGSFVYTYPPEAFMTYLYCALVAGLFLASPYIFYQLWSFVAPGLYPHERKWLIPIAFFSALCFVGGAMFGYFLVFPSAFTFFASFAGDGIVFMPKLDEYFSFALKLLFAFGVVFELPIFIFFLANLGVVTPDWLAKQRKYAVLVNFIIAAILTPTPDAMTQILMAAPMIVLYEVGILVARLFGRRPPKVEEPEEEEDEPTQADGTA